MSRNDGQRHGSGRNRRTSAQTRDRFSGWRNDAPALLFLAILAFGGGAGTGYPLIELIAQVLALGLIVRAALPGSIPARLEPGVVGLGGFLLVFAAGASLSLLQIVPLPPTWWHGLPGRETATQIFALLGWSGRWHAFSLAPDATLAALLALLVPLAAMLTVASLRLSQRVMLLRLIVGAAVIATILATLQVAAGVSSAPILYETAHRGFGVGFFVNRNHQATLLLAAIVFAAVPGVMGVGAPRRLATLAVIAFLSLGILATNSRTALLLLPLALIVAVALVGGVRRTGRRLAGAGIVYVLVGVLLLRTDLVQRVFARFSTVAEELRYQYWENSLYIVRETFPFGIGFGSFERVYRSVEPLGQVSPLSVNHAHNDFLELSMEGGLPALVLILLGLVVVVVTLRGGWRSANDRQERATLVAGGAAIILILLFSLVDYPLRMAGIAGLFGAALGLIAAVGRVERPLRGKAAAGPGRLGASAWIAGAIAIVIGLVASGDALGRFLTLRGQGGAATAVAPWSANAWAALANTEQLAGRPAAAKVAAGRAIAIVPIDAPAVRAYGYADLSLGASKQGSTLLEAGAALGWRDTLLQLWLAERALEVGSASVAAERIDALLRRGQLPDALMRQMRATYLSPGGVDAIVTRLADRPQWRQGFFNAISSDAALSVPRTLQFLTKLRAAGVPVTEAETMLMRWRLADTGDIAGAREIWIASGGRGLIADGGFEAVPPVLPTGIIPYAWGAPRVPGIRVVPIDRGFDGTGHAIQIVSDGLSTGTALAQAMTLPPGRWRIRAMVRGVDIPATVTIACTGTASQASAPGIALDGQGSGWRPVEGVVSVDPGCRAQILGVVVRERGGQTGTFSIDSIRITPVDAGLQGHRQIGVQG
ncbi:O-antigen ligase [Sphingomonas sp. OK281]|uniref:O-antigen ligase family protein n=1 Tax=Sphingomonas sp. OK281 TaxID=1881067 RepID=UPI0008E4E9D1|nr:O-antigen ligase family protein [Sphingomonas sp. OK281]SFO29144.1 O-antigen ligase [Sphingomonas sp. OK281]